MCCRCGVVVVEVLTSTQSQKLEKRLLWCKATVLSQKKFFLCWQEAFICRQYYGGSGREKLESEWRVVDWTCPLLCKGLGTGRAVKDETQCLWAPLKLGSKIKRLALKGKPKLLPQHFLQERRNCLLPITQSRVHWVHTGIKLLSHVAVRQAGSGPKCRTCEIGKWTKDDSFNAVNWGGETKTQIIQEYVWGTKKHTKHTTWGKLQQE